MEGLDYEMVAREIWSLAPVERVSDASWVSADQKAGIAWCLHCKDKRAMIRGSSAIEAVNSPLEAEAAALRMAVQQLKRLRYQKVVFMGDCQSLYEALKDKITQNKTVWCPIGIA